MSLDNASNPTTTRRSFQSASSPFAHTPKLTPSASRRTSPARRPLHERSNSQHNQFANPTIRIVEDPGIEIYSKKPFPNQPSQILPPRNAPGYVFEGRGSRVSDATLVANAVSSTEPIQTLVPKPLQPKRAFRHSTATNTSDADTLVPSSSFSPSSSRFSQGTTPPSSPALYSFEKEKGKALLEQRLSQSYRPTIRAVPPSASSDESAIQGHALTPRASAASLASSASSDSGNYQQHEGSDDTPTASLHSQQHHDSPPETSSDEKKQASSTNKAPARPVLKTSSESLAYSDISYESTDRPRVHFPIVRQPSASILWAESRVLPKNPARMNNRASQVHQWSSQLSTIASESDRGSRSIGRRSQSVEAASLSNDDHNGRSVIPRRRTITSVTSSENLASDSGGSSISVPLPLFSPITRPSEGRDSDEHHDTVSPLQSPPLRQKRSGFLRRHDSDSRSTSSRPSSSQSYRPGSSQSDLATFVYSTIPAWARVYYRRGERTSIGAPDSSTEGSESVRVPTATSGRTNTPSEGGFPLSIYRPRTRPHNRQSNPHTDSMAISEAPVEQEVYVIGPPRRPLNEPFTPRLRQDRRSTARLSAWKAPSFDDSLGTIFFSRQNRQILLFCLGFLCPLAWILASFLPLPQDPALVESPSQVDLERQFAQALGPLDDRSYQKAMWWRNLNRVMAAVGTLLIGVIIALGILASRMN